MPAIRKSLTEGRGNMRYENYCRAVFLKRLNRFVALVELDGKTEAVHVKNTGRCGELLIPGAEAWLTEPGTAGRKYRYDLIAVRKAGGRLFNIDSQAPNKAVLEWLQGQTWDEIRPEYIYGASRMDFFMRRDGRRFLMEVKGCTLERDGIGYFPDAPTERGTKHIRELIRAAGEGWHAVLAYVIQTDGVTEVRPNRETDPVFAQAMEEARRSGVGILFLSCHVEPDSIRITGAGEQPDRKPIFLF